MISGGGGGGGASLAQGTAASRPASPTPGQLYYATDTGELTVANASGSGWQTLGRTSAANWVVGPTGNATYGSTGNSGQITSLDGYLAAMSGSNFQLGCNLRLYDPGGQRPGILVAESANGKQGTATLAAGTVVVANTGVTATSRIFLTCQTPGGTVGALYVSARTPGTSFTVTSTNASDTSTFAYEIFEVG